jgi:hypothetical protein
VIPHETIEAPSTYGLFSGLFCLLVDKEIVLLWGLPLLKVVPHEIKEAASIKKLFEARDFCQDHK